MNDDRDLRPDDELDADETIEELMKQVEPDEDELPGEVVVPVADEADTPAEDGDDYALLSTDALDDALEELEAYEPPADDETNAEADDDHDAAGADDGDEFAEDAANSAVERAAAAGDRNESGADELETVDEEDRLRGPRAEMFRRRRQNRIAFLPLALYLIGLGIFLIAREQEVEHLPDPSTLELGALSVLAGAFTMIFHSFLAGRRERGLLFTGLWLGATVSLIAALVYIVDDQPDAVEWWPLLLGGVGITLLINYVIEANHDVRLIWVAVICLLAAVIAYAFTSNVFDEDRFSTIADYWPLLVSVIGIGLVPLVFRRQLE